MRPLLDALEWFVEADTAAVEAEGPVRWAG